MNLQSTDFEIFNLPQRFALDTAVLDVAWKTLQRQAHPDRHASDSAQQQRQAMQWSVRINEAYQRLKDPLKRAAYLCERRGAAIQAENNTAMPAAFLMQQMAWREALEEAADAVAVEVLEAEVAAAEREMLADVARRLDVAGDAPAAAAQVRALMFVNRFRQDIERRLDALDPAHTR